jgi:hypothetical protein
MTTTTEVAPLVTGDLVTYEGHAARVTEPTEDDSSMHESYVLLRFGDRAHAPNGAWQDRGYPSEDGSVYYWVGRTDRRMARVEPEPYAPRLLDKVNVTEDGWDYPGTIYATTGSPVRHVWVSNDDSTQNVWGYPFADVSDASGETTAAPTSSVPDGTRGHWVTVPEVAPRETSEEGPSGPAETPAESPEVTALKAEVERLQRQISTQFSRICDLQNDVGKIGDALKATAERHEWCGEYEEHLEDLLNSLSSASVDILRDHAERATDYTVTVTYTTTVRASNSDAAIEEVQENHDWTGYADWEAEEA